MQEIMTSVSGTMMPAYRAVVTTVKGLLIGTVLALLVACGGETPDRSAQVQNDSAAADTSAQVDASGQADISAQVDTNGQADTSGQTDTSEDTGNLVLMKTSMGDIELSLDAEKAPISVENFLAYVDSDHYDGTVFHRVIAGFMVQGGGFDQELQQKDTRAPIQNEAANGLKNLKYSIAMARTQVWDSATSQFFINVADNAFLDEQYAVFGSVVSGQDVVDQIAAVQTGAAGRFRSDVPVEAVVIESVSRQ